MLYVSVPVIVLCAYLTWQYSKKTYHKIDTLIKTLKEQSEKQQKAISEIQLTLFKVSVLLKDLAYEDKSNWSGAKKLATDTCTTLNQYFQSSVSFMNYTATALHATLMCLKPYVETIMVDAIEDEDYESAQVYQQLLSEINKIVSCEENNNNNNKDPQ